MSKKLQHTITYPKPVDRAWSDITNPAYQEGRLTADGATSITVTIEPAGDGSAEVILERDNPVVGVPSAVKKVVGEKARVREHVSWGPPAADGARVAKLKTDFLNAPLAMSGSLTLTPRGEVTDLRIDAEFKSSIPVVGGKFEDTALKETIKTMDSEARFSAGFTG